MDQAERHLRNLYALAKADGKILEIEEHLMISIAHRLGLGEGELENIRLNANSYEFMLPEKYDDRVEQFQDLLMLMSIDGDIDNEELAVCKKMATKYEFTEPEFQNLLSSYLK